MAQNNETCACRHIGLRRRQPQSLGLQRRTQGIALSYMPTIAIGGGNYTLATWEEYMQFKMHMNIKIGGMLLDKPSFDEIEK
jgi:hypothetical protein